jgi:hypothetical protein
MVSTEMMKGKFVTDEFGYVENELFLSQRAMLELESVSIERGEDKRTGDPYAALEVEHRVLEYEESDEMEGETFSDRYYFKKGKNPRTGKTVFGFKDNSKIGKLLPAALGEQTWEALKSGKQKLNPDDLVGKRIWARVTRSGLEEDGDYSAVDWKSIGPVVAKKTTKNAPEHGNVSSLQEAQTAASTAVAVGAGDNDPEADFDDIPF